MSHGFAGEILSDIPILYGAGEVSVTGTATLNSSAFGRLHVCIGSSAYTITLPASSSNTNKLIGFRFATTSDAIVTLDGNSSETIGGALTAQYVAGEWVTLYCDGSNWRIADEWLLKPTFQAYRATSDQSISNATFTKVQLNAEEDDSHGWFDSATNYRFQPKAPGIYQFSANMFAGSFAGAGEYCDLLLYKNGAAARHFGNFISPAAVSMIGNGACQLELNGSTDYAELYFFRSSVNSIVLGASSIYTFLGGNRVRRL